MRESLARKWAVKAAKRQPRSVGRSLLPPDEVGRVRGGRGRRRRCPPPRARCSSRIPYCVSQLLHNFFGLGVSESASAVARPSSRSLFCQGRYRAVSQAFALSSIGALRDPIKMERQTTCDSNHLAELCEEDFCKFFIISFS